MDTAGRQAAPAGRVVSVVVPTVLTAAVASGSAIALVLSGSVVIGGLAAPFGPERGTVRAALPRVPVPAEVRASPPAPVATPTSSRPTPGPATQEATGADDGTAVPVSFRKPPESTVTGPPAPRPTTTTPAPRPDPSTTTVAAGEEPGDDDDDDHGGHHGDHDGDHHHGDDHGDDGDDDEGSGDDDPPKPLPTNPSTAPSPGRTPSDCTTRHPAGPGPWIRREGCPGGRTAAAVKRPAAGVVVLRVGTHGRLTRVPDGARSAQHGS